MEPGKLKTNPKLELAFSYIEGTNKPVFLTGKAGTGKTTFLNRLRESCPKRMVVVAPTGVAAINARGVTIHSLFQLPFTPFVPGSLHGRDGLHTERFSKEKRALLKSIDLLVIDEISMVRCDVLDAMDRVLRQVRQRGEPFGGVQVLMIGDINQLAPVARDEDWSMLRPHYESVYFFSSHVLRDHVPVIIELTDVYRQTDQHFIDILNQVRDKRVTAEAFASLNARLNRNALYQAEHAGYITLTTHNQTARKINTDKMNQLEGEATIYHAQIQGDYPEYSYPTYETLEIKPGAQVMFVRNDSSREKRYFNGKIGRVEKAEENLIHVSTDDKGILEVETEIWENIRYKLNPETKVIEEEVIGSFRQFPLKHAWAITIHKSQGLTFDRVIIDAGSSFSSGQVYVALSRCRSLEGIVLNSRLTPESIISDQHVDRFNALIAGSVPDHAGFEQAQRKFQMDTLMDLLDLKVIETDWYNLIRRIQEHAESFLSDPLENILLIENQFEQSVRKVIPVFRKQIAGFFNDAMLPEEHPDLQERLKKAAVYFNDKLEELQVQLAGFPLDIRSKEKQDEIGKFRNKLMTALAIKRRVFQCCLQEGFKTGLYLQALANAETDLEQSVKPSAGNPNAAPYKTEVVHKALFRKLSSLRKSLADLEDKDPVKVIPTYTLTDISNKLPQSLQELEGIRGMNTHRLVIAGELILKTVTEYCLKHRITPGSEEALRGVPKREKGETYRITLEMYQGGMTPDQIAAERKLSPVTIEGHLARYIESGVLDISPFVSNEVLSYLADFILAHPEWTTKDIMDHHGSRFSYSELRYVNSYLNRHKKEKISSIH